MRRGTLLSLRFKGFLLEATGEAVPAALALFDGGDRDHRHPTPSFQGRWPAPDPGRHRVREALGHELERRGKTPDAAVALSSVLPLPSPLRLVLAYANPASMAARA